MTTQRLGELLRGARRSAGLKRCDAGDLKDQDAEQQLQLTDESMQTILKLLR